MPGRRITGTRPIELLRRILSSPLPLARLRGEVGSPLQSGCGVPGSIWTGRSIKAGRRKFAGSFRLRNNGENGFFGSDDCETQRVRKSVVSVTDDEGALFSPARPLAGEVLPSGLTGARGRRRRHPPPGRGVAPPDDRLQRMIRYFREPCSSPRRLGLLDTPLARGMTRRVSFEFVPGLRCAPSGLGTWLNESGRAAHRANQHREYAHC
jgi:hypothetical protein